jgi:hypothetical protein
MTTRKAKPISKSTKSPTPTSLDWQPCQSALSAQPTRAPARPSKLETVLQLLRQPKGTTIDAPRAGSNIRCGASSGSLRESGRRPRLSHRQGGCRLVKSRPGPIEADPAVEAELDRLPTAPIFELRERYRELLRTEPPKAFGPDLLRRSIAHAVSAKPMAGWSCHDR